MGAKKGLDPIRICDVKHFFLRSQAPAGLAAAPLKPNRYFCLAWAQIVWEFVRV
jgi:hypothetical protein